MAKVEPWFKPRDEDGDDELINQLGRASRQGPPRGSGSGCVVLVLAGAAAGALVSLAPVVIR